MDLYEAIGRQGKTRQNYCMKFENTTLLKNYIPTTTNNFSAKLEGSGRFHHYHLLKQFFNRILVEILCRKLNIYYQFWNFRRLVLWTIGFWTFDLKNLQILSSRMNFCLKDLDLKSFWIRFSKFFCRFERFFLDL